jgi:hypothetical protein
MGGGGGAQRPFLLVGEPVEAVERIAAKSRWYSMLLFLRTVNLS